MKLRVLTGRAGSGKSRKCIEEITEYLGKADRNRAFLIVPEQFMINAERRLLEAENCNGLMRDEVLSFRRLAYMCFKEAEEGRKPAVDKVTDVLIMAKTLACLSEDLEYYGEMCGNQEFTVNMLSQISEFERYLITPDMLSALSEKEETKRKAGFPEKLRDLSAIYKKYKEFLNAEYYNAADEAEELVKLLSKEKILEGCRVWIDEFHGFTGQEYKIIGELLKQADQVTVCLCKGEKNEPVFESQEKTYRNLLGMAKNLGIKAENIQCDSEMRYRGNKYLAHLEKSFFRYPCERIEEEPTGITLTECASPFEEVICCAEKIKKYVKEDGLKYSDISVMISDPDTFEKITETVFDRYGIPYFADRKKDPADHPYARFVYLFLSAVKEKWNTETVFDILKTGISGYDREAADYLELYFKRTGLSGKGAWKKKVNPKIFMSMRQNAMGEAYEKAENLRKIITSQIEKAEEAVENAKNVKSLCKNLAVFLSDSRVTESIEKKEKEIFETEGEERAAEFIRGYEAVNKVIKTVYGIMGDAETGSDISEKAESFLALLSLGLSQCKVGYIPVTTNCVQIGTKERTRSHETECVFLLGANDGLLPKKIGGYGIISDSERKLMNEMDMETAGDDRQMAVSEQFNIYTVLTLPRRELNISYFLCGLDNKNAEKSAAVERLCSIFPGLKTERDGDTDKLIKAYRALDEIPEFSDMTPKKLYLNDGRIRSSFSDVDSFSSCPFKYYLSRVLGIQKEDTETADSREYGSAVHEILHKAVEAAAKDKTAEEWSEITLEECRNYVNKFADGICAEILGRTSEVEELSNRNKYIVSRIKESAAECMYESRGFGKPSEFETSFGYDSSAPVSRESSTSVGPIYVDFCGKIDRIDISKKYNGDSVTVIDYKTKESSTASVKKSHEQQLLLYMEKVLSIYGGNLNLTDESHHRVVNMFYDSISEKPLNEKEYSSEKADDFYAKTDFFAENMASCSFGALPSEETCAICDFIKICRTKRKKSE